MMATRDISCPTLIESGDNTGAEISAPKRGYLTETFRIFRLHDPVTTPIPFHYHDFHKIILFISGQSGYTIEGKTWQLSPRDIVFVHAGEIHRPLPLLGAPYERIVIYVAPELLSRYRHGTDDLAACFLPEHRPSNVMHLTAGKTHDLLFHMEKLERTAHASGFANALYTEMLFVEFMILLNRALIDRELDATTAAVTDEKIQALLTYINDHLTERLSIDRLAARSYVSRSHLMHRFKRVTGYGVRQYIVGKRLLLARAYLTDTTTRSISEIARLAGFDDYLPFFRAFKAQYQMTPQEWRERHGSVSAEQCPMINPKEDSTNLKISV